MLTNTYEYLAIILRSLLLVANCIRSPQCETSSMTRLRPTCDRKMLQPWANRRKNVRPVEEVVRLVAEVVGERKRKTSRNNVDGHVQNLKPDIQNRKRRTISRATGRATLQPVARPIDCSRRIPRLIVRSITVVHDWSYDRSFMDTTSRTISYDMMDLVIDILQSVLIAPPHVRPMVWWPTTSKKDRSQHATASGDRSKHCRSVARSPNRNQSYDQAIHDPVWLWHKPQSFTCMSICRSMCLNIGFATIIALRVVLDILPVIRTWRNRVLENIHMCYVLHW